MRSTSEPDSATGVAGEFAARLGELARTPLSPPIAHEAKRALANVLGLAIGAAHHPGVDAIVATARVLGGPATAPVLGRGERADAHFAALAAGFAAHVDDFDDTHLATVIHPGAACMAVLVALAEETKPSGTTALTAFALGCEAQLRLGVAISPEHYDRGWHITGTCGVAGAAVTAALLLGFDDAALARAVRLSMTMPLGHRDAFGTMTKAFHPGKAAANGILAARLAAENADAPSGILEDPRGFAAALSTRFDPAQMLDDLGTRWELAQNTYKPYPCGIVAHPSIDAALALRERIDVNAIESLRAHCHALVPELMGNPDPQDGLEARFSAIHGIAVALRDGRAGLPQYEPERVRRADVRELRAKTTLVPSPDVARDAARLEARLHDGTTVEEQVAHARGSTARPLTDAELFAKVRLLIEPQLGARSGQRLIEAMLAIDEARSIDTIIAPAVPEASTHV
ncbi:MAG: MmgE/PrpD family protein [Candidatus Eremiobacteraeota bacterium]|nr:MmgE/PrpD family protein [Candidatus Eremiobacteraeota bacterium]